MEEDFIVEIIFHAYEKLNKLKVPQYFNESFAAVAKSLNKKQLDLLYEFDDALFRHIIEVQKDVIKFFVYLMCPNIVSDDFLEASA